MLYVNDELVKKGTPCWERYNEFLQKLQKMPDPVIFKTGRPIRFNSTGLKEPFPQEWIPLQETIYGEEGDEYWVYCERPPRKKENGKMIYSPRGRTMVSSWKFDKKKDADLIFFFSEISSFRERGRVVLEDRQADARKVIGKEIGELDVKHMILSKYSPLSVEETGSEDTLRMVASAWGVADVNKLSIEEVKVELLSTVQTANAQKDVTKRGYAEFLKEVNSREKLVVRANVQKAIDTGVITYDEPTFTWRFAANNQPLMIVPASEGLKAQLVLNNFLYLNEKLASVVAYALEKPYVDKPKEVVQEPVQDIVQEPVPDPEPLSGLKDEEPFEDKGINRPPDIPAEKQYTMAELRKWAKENGINSFGKKKDELVLLKEKSA